MIPPICGYALPIHVHFAVKAGVIRKSLFLDFSVLWLAAFPLNRGAIDKVAIRHALGLLKDNKVLSVFAEGNRQKNRKLGRFHDGATYLRCVRVVALHGYVIGSP